MSTTDDLTDAQLRELRTMAHNLWHDKTRGPVERTLASLAYRQTGNIYADEQIDFRKIEMVY